MRYLLPGLIILPLLLAGCTEANYIKLTHQAKACVGDNTVHCTDIRIRQAIAETKLKRKKLTDEEDQALTNIGRTNYERLLAVFDQKIAHLQDQRPNVLKRWFSGDTEDYDEIDLGWRYDAQMEQLVREINVALQDPGQSQPAKQSVTTPEAISPAANPLLADQQQEQTPAIASQALPHYSGSPQTDNAFNQFIKQHTSQVVILNINIQGDYERELITYGYRGVSPTFSTVQNRNFDYTVFINCEEINNSSAEDSIGKCSPAVQWDQNTGKLSGTFRIEAKGRNDMKQSLIELVAVPAA